jgi:hypothetical protein
MDILTGLGLSGSAGLNAYLPLFIMGVMHRLGWLTLTDPYDNISAWPIMILLGILLLIEMTADKIPAVDTANDAINTIIRPLAGAILFSASTGSMQNVDPTLMTAASLLSGSVAAGGIHAIKASVRPGVTLATAGMGNAFVSVIEDGISASVSLIAILLPFIVIFFFFSAVSLTGWIMWDTYRVRQYFRTSTSEFPTLGS